MRQASVIAARASAALLGGYALANALPIGLFAPLALERADAALWAAQVSFVVYAAAVLWAFAARSVVSAWAGLLGPAALTGLAGWWLL
jgi:hypothetical protein